MKRNLIIAKLTVTLLLLILSITILQAQKGIEYTTRNKKAIKYYETATQLYDNRQNDESLKELDKAIKEDDKFIEAYFLRAANYTDKKDVNQAIAAYLKGISIEEYFFPTAYISVANLQLSIGKYQEARVNFQNFFKIKRNALPHQKEAVNKGVERAEFGMYQMQHPVDFKPVNLGDSVNSIYDEYLPTLTADEQTLIITVRRPADEMTIDKSSGFEEDFYISKKINGVWSKAISVGPPLNSHGNEGAQCISPDGHTIYFTACNRSDGLGSCDIYTAKYIGGHWTTPVNMGPKVNSSKWDSQPSISADGMTLFFSSSRPGGKGKMDIWKTMMDVNGEWGVPVNLGDSINSPDDEMSPFIHPDNHTLYFASNGHLGMGGMDLFYARKKDNDKWSKPVNLGYPINTYADEVNLIVNTKGDYAYFSSNRLGGNKSNLQLYGFELYKEARPMMVNYMKGVVYDEETKKRLEAKFELIELNSGNTEIQSKSDPVNGEFLVCLPSERNFALNVSKDGYLFYSENISIKGNHSTIEPYLKDIALKPVKIGESVVLNNIFFETDKFDLKEESKIELNRLLTLLKNNQKMKIEIGGHTDNVGGEKHNQALSESRAKAVYDYLEQNGINKLRLSYKGYASTKPIATNDTEEGRAKNRRTEFSVIGN